MDAGQRLGMYRLVERLGRGGFAEVWRARPEPATAFGEAPSPETLALGTRALAALLRGAPASAGQAPAILAGLAEQQERLGKARAERGARRPAPEPRRGEGALADDELGAATGQASAHRSEAPSDVPAALLAAEAEAARAAFRWVEELAATGDLDVAVKVPFHDGWVRQLRREKDVLRRVEHPRLVRQLELDVAHEPPFLAMELVRGWSLRDALRSEPRPPMAKVLAIMDQLLTVLQHLHARGVVHGDVKPENILLEPDGALRLIDLGLGQVSQAVLRDAYLSLSLAARVPILGTLSYMAPEVRKGLAAGPAADLYSAGIVLYEMLVGDVPHGMTLPSEAVPERELSPRFDVLLKWVLHPDPARRVPSARELRERILVTLRERPRHQYGSGRGGVAREGTHAFDEWALGAASPFVAGDWIGPWQLEAPLGRGGFGEVWKARRGPDAFPALRADGAPPGPDQVALKIALGPHGKDGLQREAEVARRLSHPRIPAVRDAALAHDPPYLVVDFAAGRSLRARLVEDGPLEPAELVPALASLVSALVHCHAEGVVHRDLKPENLLLDEEHGTLTLLDFGLATCPELEERQRVEVSRSLESKPGGQHGDGGGGTFEYMAPERKRGAPGAPPADAYAVGVIVFELLTGELPRGLTRLRELKPLTPPWLEALVAKLLDPAPDARPTLLQLQQRLGSEAAPTRVRLGVARRGLQAIERRRAAVLSVVGALLVGGVLVAAGRPRRGPEPEARPTRTPAALRPEPLPEWANRELMRVALPRSLRQDVRELASAPLEKVSRTVTGLAVADQAFAQVAGITGGPITRRLVAARALAERRGAAEAAEATARSLDRQDPPAPDELDGAGLGIELAKVLRVDEAYARALELDPDGPGAGERRVARDGLRTRRLALQGEGLRRLAGAPAPESLLPLDPAELEELVRGVPEADRVGLGLQGQLAALAEGLAMRGDVDGVARISSSAVLRPLLRPAGPERSRVEAALHEAFLRRDRGLALVARAAEAPPLDRWGLLAEAAGLLPERDHPLVARARARAELLAADSKPGERRRRARESLWGPDLDAAALALALAGDDGELRLAAQALLGEVAEARTAIVMYAGAVELSHRLELLSRAERAVAAAEAVAATCAPPARPEALRAVGLARCERALARDAIRDVADPLPPP